MSIRKTNPERKPSLKKTLIPSIVQISPNYKQIMKNFEVKQSQESTTKLLTLINSFFIQWNEKSVQFQQAHPRQSLIKGLVQVSQQHDGLSIITKLKIVKLGLQLVFKMNLASEDSDKVKSILIEFKGLLDVGIRISQDSKNDKSVSDSGIIKVIFQLLASLYQAFAFRIQKNQKKILSQPQRKNSLKKNDNFPIIQRPKSRQKLSSLSKRDSKPSISLLSTTTSTLKQEEPAQTIEIQDIILSLLTLTKNCGANNDLKKKILQEQCLNLLNKYIQVWTDKNINAMGNKMLIQITSTHRHLAVEQKSFKIFMLTKTVTQWIRLLQIFPTYKDIMLNLLRLFSKLSTVEECCEILDSRQLCVRNLISFFATYKTDIYIIIRVSFIFANMTAYLVDIRNKMYFKYSAFTDIYQCFDYYITSELKGKVSDIDKMGISKMAWDYQAMKKQSDIEALVKIIRLIANLLTINEIGMDIYVNKGIQFRDLIKKLKILLEKKPSIEDNPDLIICGLSCLANALFYDKQVVLSSVDHKNTKLQIITMLPNFIVQAQNEEVCCQGLRVLSNLSRSKQFISHILVNQLHQATLILLESSSKQIVYYSMGVLINLLVDAEFKAQNQQKIVRGVLDILKQCNNQDFDIITICSKCISNVAKGLTGPLVKQIQQTMDNLGIRCDSLMIRPSSAKQQKQNLQQSRKMINMVINDLTTDPFVCKVGDCGRRFGSQIELKAHVDRRHKL